MKVRTLDEIKELHKDVFENPEIECVAKWIEPNSDEFNAEEYLERAERNVEGLAVAVNDALSTMTQKQKT